MTASSFRQIWQATVILFTLLFVHSAQLLCAATIEDQIMDAEVFPEPLMWVGTNAPTQSESDDLWAIVTNSPSATWKQDLLGYVANHPSSPWTPSVRANLAIMCRQCGAYTGALQEWDAAWQATKSYTNGAGKTVGDTVIAHWSQLLASLGRTNQLKPLFDETAGRTLDKPHLEDLWRASKEGYMAMIDYPGLAYRCGTFALISVARALQITNASLETLKDEPSSGPGFSMTQLASLAQQRGLNLVGAVRTNGTNLAIPSVIHWNQNHYAAVITNFQGAYWIKDPTFGRGVWMHRDAINVEASGKFLVLSNQLPTGYRLMTQQEMDSTWGQGQPNNIDDWKDEGCDKSPGGRGAPAKSECPPCAEGMPRWWVTEPYINLWVADEPLSYTLSNGERFSFRFTYKQRRNLPVNQYLFPTRSARTTNTLWEHNFLSHLQYRDPVYDSYVVNDRPLPSGYQKFQNWEVLLFVPGGGLRTYTSNATVALGESRSRIRVEPIGNLDTYTGLPGFPQSNYFCPTNPVTGFRVMHPDGSQEIYSLNFLSTVAVSSSPSRAEAVLTMRIDPSGRTTRLCYEGWFTGYPNLNQNSLLSFVRIKHVIDPDGRTNTFSYFDGFQPYVGLLLPKHIRAIEDPYGRAASFVPYLSPPSIFGFTSTMVDAANNTNYFTYDRFSTNGLLQTMITPYGTTAFVSYDVDSDRYSTNNLPPGNLGGHNRVNRSMAVGEPNGAKYLFMYRYDSPSFLPAAFATNQVPPGSWEYVMDNGGASGFTLLSFRNSFYWGPKNYPLTCSPGDGGCLTGITSNQFRFARWRHWLDSERDDMTLCSDRISLERAPAPGTVEAGHVTWFSYRGKFASHRIGSASAVGAYGDEHQIGLIANVLPDGSTRYDEFRYWSGAEFPAKPFPREVRSTYTMTNGSAGSRTTVYEYHSNNIDLHRVYGPDGDLEETYTYNTNHQALTYSNAVAETYSFAYDAITRNLTSITTPGGLTISRNYYPSNASDPFNRNMLASVIELPINRTNRFTYINGLPNLHTNELGLRLSYTFDGLDRLTRVDFLDDGTFTSNRYSKLDLVGSRDRLGNWTLLQYDAAQRLIAVTNANTNVTRLAWCGCGALEGITNALSQPTTFTYDQQSRRTGTLNADASSLIYQYDPLGRLIRVTDGASRGLNYSYNNQGLLAAVSNDFGPVLGVVYDREDRPVQITDAEGVTVTNAFDNLNRLTNRSWAGGGNERTIYSFAGTNVTTINPLGHTNRAIFDAALRLLWHTNANFEVTKFSYNPAGQITSLIDGKNQTTTWNYDRFGRMTNKIDALTREIFRLTYDSLDRATNRWTPAKGNVGYSFDALGNLKSTTYSNASPFTLSYLYDPLSRLTNMADAVGTTRFTYTAGGRLDTEDGPWTSDSVSRSYIEGQRTSLSLQQPLASSWSQNYTYDSARRLQSLTSPAGVFGYDYGTANPASALISKLTLPNGAIITNAFDALAQLTNTTLLNQWRAPVDGYGYSYDKWGQRTNIVRALGAARSTLALAYDRIGQLTAANAYETNGTARLNEKLGYAYDAANNLQRRTNATLTQTFTPDAANQLSTATRSGTMTVAGLVTRPATNATVNGQGTVLYADQTYASSSGLTLTNNGTNTFTVIAQSATGLLATNTLNSYLPTTFNFAYDANGNLTNDGVRAFYYDAECQLTNITVAGAWRSEFLYDGLNRRRIRKEYTWNAGAWLQTNETRYMYDGLLVLQERDSNNIPVLTYTRGPDLSGTLQGAGGIGGLLALSDQRASATAPTNYYYHADGSGNITALLNSKNEVVARFLYDPFGNLLAMSGPMAPLNRLGFSSKERHTQSGLILYEFRPYDPNLQRWLNQDPIGEAGGINLYRFVGNDGINFIDPLGLLEYSWDGRQMLIIYPSWWQFWKSQPDVYLVHPELAKKILRDKGIEDAAVNAAAALAALELQKKLLKDQEKRQTPPKNCPKPPGWNDKWKWGPPSGEKEGDWRWFDPEGGEWRRHEKDKWHPDPHWDFNPWDNWNSPWRNLDDKGNPIPKPIPPTPPPLAPPAAPSK